MTLTLHFLRHGQTALSRDNVFCGSGMDPELTPDGETMAESFAAWAEKRVWAAVYSSPLRRALATAAPLCAKLEMQPEVHDGLKEIGYGLWEGKSAAEVSRDYHDDHLRWSADPAWNAPTGGERAVEIAHRVMTVVALIRARHAAGNVLVVSHKATIRIAICSLLGLDVGRFRDRIGCPVGSVSSVEFASRGPLLHVLADRSHQDERLRSLPGT
jgi:broad specificity phosphatase PhoE